MNVVLRVFVEPLERPQVGIWCDTCALPSGVSMRYAISGDLPPVVAEYARCRECGGEVTAT